MKNEAKIGRFLVGGQPSDEEIAGLKDRGYTTVVNVRMPEEQPEPERPRVESAGGTYVSVPYTGASLTREHIAEIEKALEGVDPGSVLIH